jgi:hypothetical protein
MPKREKSKIERIHVWLYAEDVEFLKDTYGRTIGVAKAVRTIVNGFHKRVREKATQVQDSQPRSDFDIEVPNVLD